MKKGLTHIILLCILSLSSSYSHAQTSDPLGLPSSTPKPDWINKIDWQHIDISKHNAIIEESIKKAEALKKSKNMIKNRTLETQEPNEEDPYTMAYRRWLRAMRPYIKEDGTIDLTQKKSIIISDLRTNALPVAGKWTCLGPKETTGDRVNINSDPPTINSCYNANIRTLTIDPNDPNTLYAGAESAVVFKSTDKGKHWQSISDSWSTNENISAIAVSKVHPNTILALSGFYRQGDLYQSTDGGNNWKLLQSGTGNNWSGNWSVAMKYNPTSNRVYLAGGNGIYISDNDGVSWNAAVGTNAIKIHDIAINSKNSNIVYGVGRNASSNLVLLKSIDGGNSFQDVTGTFSTTNNIGAKIGVTDADGSIIYCVVLSNSGAELLKSTNSGQNWVLQSSSNQTVYEGYLFPNTGLMMSNVQGFYNLAIFVAPTNPQTIIVGTTTTYKSVDGGLNFNSLGGWNYGPFGAFKDDASHSGSIIHPDVHSIVGVPGDTYIATDGGIAHSTDIFTDPQNAEAINNGLSAAEYYGLGQGWQEDLVVGGRYHNGDAVLFEGYPDGTALYVNGAESPSGNTLPGYAMTARFSDLYTTYIIPPTLSRTALKVAPGIQSNMGPHFPTQWTGERVGKLMTDPRYRDVLFLSGNAIKDGYGNTDESSTLWKSTNTGVNYTSLHDFGSTVWRFDIAKSNPNVIIVYTDLGLYKTTNGGGSWSPLPAPSGVTYSQTNFSDIAIDPSDEQIVFLTVVNRLSSSHHCTIFKSINGGSTWTDYTGSIGNHQAVYLCPDGTNGGVYTTTTYELPGKVFYRNNTMNDWVDFSNGLPANQIITPPGSIFFRDNKIRIAGNRGVWESPLYTPPKPIAQPMASTQSINCGETIYFNDYSILNYNGLNLNSKPASWQWTLPEATYLNGTTSVSQNPQVTYSTAGPHAVTLTVTDGSGLVSTTMVPDMIKVVGSFPETPTISVNGAVLTSSATDGNQWYINGNPIPGATSQDYTITNMGTYTVLVTNAGGCSTYAAAYDNMEDDFIVYPNPNNGQFQITKPATMQIVEIKIYDIFGHFIYQSKMGEMTFNLQGKHTGAGVYIIEVKTGPKTYKAKKFILREP